MRRISVKNLIFTIALMGLIACKNSGGDSSSSTPVSSTPTPSPSPSSPQSACTVYTGVETNCSSITPGTFKAKITWSANHESAVNRTGGGYKIYYSKTSGFSICSADYAKVSYSSGSSSPTQVTICNLDATTYYFKVVAFSSLNAYGATGGSSSQASTETSVTLH